MKTWDGAWREKIDERIRALGFSSLDDYLLARRGLAYVAMAEELGEGVLGVHLARLELESAHESGSEAFREAAKRSLVRSLGEPHGDDPFDVSGCSIWASRIAMVDATADERATEVCRRLLADAPPGWRPSTETDPLLAKTFDAVWPCNQVPESRER
jgi:hypothetical protein